MPNVKRLFVVITAIFSTLLMMNTAFAQEHVWKAADGVYKYAPGDRYESMFVVTDEGVIAIEPVNIKHSQGLLKAIRSVTEKPVRYLLHSHNHWLDTALPCPLCGHLPHSVDYRDAALCPPARIGGGSLS